MRVARLWRRDMPPPPELPVQSTRAAARALDFAVDSFECIPVDEENALMRVRGEWGEAPTSSPALAVHASGRTLLFEPLPAAPGATDDPDSSSWQAGYALPAAEITRAARFSLKVGTRSVTLPVPERSADLRHEEPDESATESDREPASAGGAGVPDIQRITAWWAEDSERHIAALEQLRGELEVERSARADLYAEAVRLRAAEPESETEIAELSAQLERAREVHEGDVAARDRLRRELEALTVVLSDVQDELRRATAVVERQASDARAQQERVSDLVAQLEARTIERDGLARELEGLWGVGDELESVRAERAREAGDWQARLDAAAADVVRLEQERDELRSALEDARSRGDLESSGRSELESRLAAAEEARSLQEQRAAELSDRLETLSAERDELHAAQQEMSSRIAEQETALEEALVQATRADEERSKLESRLEAAQLEVLERTERLSEVAQAMEQHEELSTELGEARLTLERDAKRISELERRLDETLLAEERARETVAQHQEADSIRDHAMVELERTLADTRQQVFDLQEQLDEAREALRRGVGERLWQLEP